MKNKLFLALASAALLFAGCAKDQALYDKVDDLDKRVTTLEEQVKELNEKTVPGLQATVAAIQNGVLVSKVVKTSEGYTIYFSDGTTAVLKNGDKGETGDVPVVAAKEVDGVFYWTVNGEIMKDADGNPVRVYTALPQFRVNNGKWEVSYDEGATWTVVEIMGEATALPISIIDDDDTVTFVIGDESYVIQKEHPFFITFNLAERKNIGVPQGEEFMYEYTISGVQADDELEVDILNVTAGWEARVVSLPSGETPGYIAVKNVDNVDGKVFVYAANGRGKTDIKSLVFEGGVLTADLDVKLVEAEGGNITLTVVTNMEYELYIPKTQSWLTRAPETKATHTDVITLVAEANETDGYRSAIVDVILQNMDTKEFVVLQSPSKESVTSIASVANLPDQSAVTIYNVTVLATSTVSAIVSDGEANLYCTELELPVGKVVNLAGVKLTDADKNVYFKATSYEVAAESSDVTCGDMTYYGVTSYYAPMYTSVTGTIAQTEGGYTLNAYEGQVVNIDAPVASVGMDALVGKFATVYGFSAAVAYDEEDNEVYAFVATESSEVVLTENAGWTLSYKLDPTVDSADYPECITNTVSGTNVPYMLGVLSKEAYEEAGVENAILQLSDDIQYIYWYYGLLAGYTPEQVYSMLVHDETYTETFKKFAYGEYVAIAAGINPDGTLTGDYKITPFEKVDPSVPAEYSDFLGSWIIGNNTVVVSEKVNGQSYTIEGLLPGITSDGKVLEGLYDSDAKNMVVMEQKVGNRVIESYGNCSVHFMALYNDGTSVYPGWPVNAEEPGSALVLKLQKDATVTVEGGQVFDKYDEKYYDVVGYRVRWIIDEGANAGKGNWDGAAVDLPIVATKAQEAEAEYKAWLGNYTINTVDKEGAAVEIPVELAQGIPNETILLNGLGIDGLPLSWNKEKNSLVMSFGSFSSNSTYDFYASGITNDNYVATGDANGDLVEISDVNGAITAKSIVYALSEERPEVYAAYWGVLGYKLSTSGWVTFTDCKYVYNNATFVKGGAAPSSKSTSSLKVEKSFKFDPSYKAPKFGASVQRSVSADKADARAQMYSKKIGR